MSTPGNAKVTIRMTPEEVEFLDRRAKESGMSRAAYARAILGGTSLGQHVVGKVERSGDGRQRGGVAAVIRPAKPSRPVRAVPTLRGGHDTRNDRCPAGCGFTTTIGAGKRRCSACGWTGPV